MTNYNSPVNKIIDMIILVSIVALFFGVIGYLTYTISTLAVK